MPTFRRRSPALMMGMAPWLLAGCQIGPAPANSNLALDLAVPEADAGGDAGCVTNDPRVTAGPPLCTDHWCWSLPRPQGNSLLAIAGMSATDLWAVGEHGTALHFDGVGWTGVPAPSAKLTAIAIAGAARWVVGEGVAAAWDGVAFQSQALPPAAQTDLLVAAWASGPADAWAVGYGTTLHFDGQAWSLARAEGARDVSGSAANDVWLAGATLVHWNGQAFSAAGPSRFVPSQVRSFGPADVWAVGKEAGHDGGPNPHSLFHWNGTAWTAVDGWQKSIGLYGDIWMRGSRSDDLWLFADGGGAGIAHWDGTSWSSVSPPAVLRSTVPIFNAWVSGPSDVWAVGERGAIEHWDGCAWSGDVRPPVPRALWSAGPNDVWAVTRHTNGDPNPYYAGPIIHFDGTRWTPSGGANPMPQAQAIWGSGPKDIWVGGLDRPLLHFDGQSWTPMDGGPSDGGVFGNPYVNGIWGSGSNDVWAVGNRLLHFDGKRWSEVGAQLSGRALSAVWGSAANDVWAVGQIDPVNNELPVALLLHWDGAAWTQVNGVGKRFMNSVWGSGASDVWVACSFSEDGNNLVHFDGHKWESRATPVKTTELRAVWGSGPKDVWVAGSARSGDGVVLHYDGTAWSKSSLASDDFSAISGSGAGDVWLAGAGLLHRGP